MANIAPKCAPVAIQRTVRLLARRCLTRLARRAEGHRPNSKAEVQFRQDGKRVRYTRQGLAAPTPVLKDLPVMEQLLSCQIDKDTEVTLTHDKLSVLADQDVSRGYFWRNMSDVSKKLIELVNQLAAPSGL